MNEVKCEECGEVIKEVDGGMGCKISAQAQIDLDPSMPMCWHCGLLDETDDWNETDY